MLPKRSSTTEVTENGVDVEIDSKTKKTEEQWTCRINRKAMKRRKEMDNPSGKPKKNISFQR